MDKIDLYRKMYLIRKSEDVIVENYSDNGMKTPMHMSKGSEAISVGVLHQMNKDDQVFGTYRSHAPYLAKTEDVKGFFAEMYGKKTGICEGKSGSMHLCNIAKGYVSSSAIVASNIPVAVGAAWANKMQNNGKIVVVFFGEGAMDEGNFWESLNMASLWHLPILFVCEDNRLAVHTNKTLRQGYENILGIVEQFNIANEYSMATDVMDVSEAARTVLMAMEKFDEPGFLQLEYYRYYEHVGINPDSNEGYRKLDWQTDKIHDPILNLKKDLIKDNTDVSIIEQEVDAKIYEALEFAKNSSSAPIYELYKDVYYE